ncbi:MAG: hypothetical protein DIU71_13925 [Proteobacteria bacterium]|nr:MAG: hypothetical protein DIU71_13925 [Pseudomonadota bacterium]
MISRLTRTSPPVLRPRITPDPKQAAELLRRMNALSYSPENGFHRDRMQSRVRPPRLRIVK